jgi:DNA-directed RNA polymerase subunit RPC12/RpoP
MAIRFQCMACGKRYRVDDSKAGKSSKCKICGNRVEVPRLPVSDELTPAGQPLFRHGASEHDFEPAFGDEDSIERIVAHIEDHIGPVAEVCHELISHLVHVDIYIVAPTAERPYHTLITSGMSDRPMTTPPGVDLPKYAEIVISLPPDWPLTRDALADERNYWPIRMLKTLARFPHEHQTWLGFGHTVANHGEPALPYAENTELCCALFFQPLLVPKEALSLELDDQKTIWFYSVIPLYEDEMDLKLKKGSEALFKRLMEKEVNELLNIRRKSVCKKSRRSL